MDLRPTLADEDQAQVGHGDQGAGLRHPGVLGDGEAGWDLDEIGQGGRRGIGGTGRAGGQHGGHQAQDG